MTAAMMTVSELQSFLLLLPSAGPQQTFATNDFEKLIETCTAFLKQVSERGGQMAATERSQGCALLRKAVREALAFVESEQTSMLPVAGTTKWGGSDLESRRRDTERALQTITQIEHGLM
jgi:hypothetical protein